MEQQTKPAYSLVQLTKYFLKLGSIGFGGPPALVSYMHRDLVEKKKWISESDYKEGLTLAQLAPGPLAAQLAIYIGYVDYKILGATLAGVAFVIPSFIMVLLLGYAYVLYGGLPWMQAVFYGIGAAVIGIIAIGTYKLTKKSLGKDWLLWAIFGVVAIVTFLLEREVIWLILAGGLVYWVFKTKPKFSSANSFLFSFFFLQISFGPVQPGFYIGGTYLKQFSGFGHGAAFHLTQYKNGTINNRYVLKTFFKDQRQFAVDDFFFRQYIFCTHAQGLMFLKMVNRTFIFKIAVLQLVQAFVDSYL